MSDVLLGKGQWLELREISFLDRKGRSCGWEFVRRSKGSGASAVVALTPLPDRRIALIRQWRPPIGGPVLELPAGLIEEGSNATQTALRELEEETGCRGIVVSEGPAVYNSPGLTDEAVTVAVVEVQSQGTSRPEDAETIELVWAPWRGLGDFLRSRAAAGDAIDAKLWCVALGQEIGR